MVIHTFGDYARFHPHLKAIVADGLFRKNRTFYVLPKCEMKQLEGIFRSRILAMLEREGEIAEEFMARVTQHIHEKGFQMVPYYGPVLKQVYGAAASLFLSIFSPLY
jgi:hypothetical protein